MIVVVSTGGTIAMRPDRATGAGLRLSGARPRRQGTGRGNANDQVVDGVREAVAAGVPVVVCSRCDEGRVEPVYGRGGGRDLAEAGAVFAGDLAGPKARVLLQLAGGDAAAVVAEAG